MIKQASALALLSLAFGAHAACVPDPPELGDIGPSSELVCDRLEHQFPGAPTAVTGRSIHSPTQVSVFASVNGRRVSLDYELFGYRWELDEATARVADLPGSR